MANPIELGEKPFLPLIDVQGNITALIDPLTKTPIAQYTYTSFGALLSQKEELFNPWRTAFFIQQQRAH